MSKVVRLQMRVFESESPNLFRLLNEIEAPMHRRNRVIQILESALSGQPTGLPQPYQAPAAAIAEPEAAPSEAASGEVEQIDVSDLAGFMS